MGVRLHIRAAAAAAAHAVTAPPRPGQENRERESRCNILMSLQYNIAFALFVDLLLLLSYYIALRIHLFLHEKELEDVRYI